jgi:hypothetical protein
MRQVQFPDGFGALLFVQYAPQYGGEYSWLEPIAQPCTGSTPRAFSIGGARIYAAIEIAAIARIAAAASHRRGFLEVFGLPLFQKWLAMKSRTLRMMQIMANAPRNVLDVEHNWRRASSGM